MDTTLACCDIPDMLGPSLTEEQAREIYYQGEEAVIMALMAMAQKLAALTRAEPTPTTPSAMIPPYQKPTTRSRRKKPGRKEGHPGCRRPPPERIATSSRSIGCRVVRIAKAA